jgi:bifunctional non-homologous end joining protein LigD
MNIIQQISLAYKDTGSDKVYHVQLEQVNDLYVVNFQYGKRNSTLTTGSKTKEPVALDKAQTIYDKLVSEKFSKGYSEGATGAIFQSKELSDRLTGIFPQLLNKTIDAQKYIDDNDFFMQEKFDGNRRIIRIEKNVVTSINKKGLEVLSPEEVITPIQALNLDIIVDGELVGEKYYIFDLLYLNGNDLKDVDALQRYNKLISLDLPNIAKAYITKQEKQAAFDLMSQKDVKKEGVVFKHKDSPYVPGRPNSGGNQLKYKFYATDTFEVISHNIGKRSINVISYTDVGAPYDMGRITIPETTPLPEIGSFVEIRYLYCHEGGKLFQTTFLNVREDQDISDCHMREIKFKSVGDEDEE